MQNKLSILAAQSHQVSLLGMEANPKRAPTPAEPYARGVMGLSCIDIDDSTFFRPMLWLPKL